MLNPIQIILIVIGIVSIGVLVIIGCVVTAVSKGVGQGAGLTAPRPPYAGPRPPPVPGRAPPGTAFGAPGRSLSGRVIGLPGGGALPPGGVACAQYGCRAANPASARFCRRCGHPLPRAAEPARRAAFG